MNKFILPFVLIVTLALNLGISGISYAGRYDGIVDFIKKFDHVSAPPVHRKIDNAYGGKTTITNKPTSDPNYPGQRFENFQMKDRNGNKIGKDTYIYDYNGKINAVK